MHSIWTITFFILQWQIQNFPDWVWWGGGTFTFTNLLQFILFPWKLHTTGQNRPRSVTRVLWNSLVIFGSCGRVMFSQVSCCLQEVGICGPMSLTGVPGPFLRYSPLPIESWNTIHYDWPIFGTYPNGMHSWYICSWTLQKHYEQLIQLGYWGQ